MTIDARRVDDDVRRKRNDGETMGTVRPGHVAHLICVGDEGYQGGGVGRENWGSIRNTPHGGVRVTRFFSTMRCACLHA